MLSEEKGEETRGKFGRGRGAEKGSEKGAWKFSVH